MAPEADPQAPKRPTRRQALAAQRAMVDAATEALDSLDIEGRAAADEALAAIRAADYSPAVIEAQAAKLWSAHNTRLAASMIRVIGQASQLAERVAEDQSKGMRGSMPTVRESRAFGRANAEAAATGQTDAPLRPPGQAPAPPPRPTPGAVRSRAGRELERLMPPKPEVALSERLHGSATKATREATQAISRATAEAVGLDRSARDLMFSVRAAGQGDLGQGQQIPKRLQALKARGEALARYSGAPDTPGRRKALADWHREVGKLDRYIYGPQGEGGARLAVARGDMPDYLSRAKGGLADTRGGYAGLRRILGEVDRHGVPKIAGPQSRALMDKAFTHWTAEKMRYNAERIMRTEQAAAYRTRQIRQYRASGAILGVRWTMQHALRRKYAMRVGPRKSGPMTGRRCICELMAGRLLTLEEAASYPRMGHPHCYCTWTPVYRGGRSGGSISQEEFEEAAEEAGLT